MYSVQFCVMNKTSSKVFFCCTSILVCSFVCTQIYFIFFFVGCPSTSDAFDNPEGSISFHVNLGDKMSQGQQSTSMCTVHIIPSGTMCSRLASFLVGWILLIFGQEKMSILRSKCDASNFSWDYLCGLAHQRMVQLNWLAQKFFL